MAARIVEGLFTCTKRWALEEALAGYRKHRAKPRSRPFSALQLCGIEGVCRVLCWLDKRGDPAGRMFGVSVEEIEFVAGWGGVNGAFVKCLVETGWVDETPEGLRWHDYGALNRLTLTDRAKKRRVRGQPGGQEGGRPGGQTSKNRGTDGGTDRGRPCPSPGDPQKDLPGQERARDLAPLGGAVAAREAEPVHVASSTLPNGLPSGVPVAPLFVPLPKRLPTPSRRP